MASELTGQAGKFQITPIAVAWIAACLWTLLLGASLFWNWHSVKEQTMAMAYAEAVAVRNKDMVFRLWAMRHGGVYVPVSEREQPAATLAHVPGRDVTTDDGRKLTLRAPAIMVREMMDDYAKDFGTRGRITGLRYLNPDNAPDAWEKAQLEAFDRGEKREVWEIADIEGKPHLRYLQAWDMEARCLKCHAVLGYKVGDVRGATGVNLPLAAYYEHLETSRGQLALTHGLVWFLGLGGMAWAGNMGRQRARERAEAEAVVARAELRYRTLFEQGRDSLLLIDFDTQAVIDCNAVTHAQLGYTHEEFLRLHIRDFDIAENEEDVRQRLEIIRERGWDDFETRLRHRDGSIRHVHILVQLLTIDERLVMQCSIRDITERKQSEESLRLYANLFEQSSEAIMVTDAENRIIRINRALEEISGYSFAELEGKNPSILSSGQTPPETYVAMWAALRSVGHWQGELWDRRKDGSIYPKWTTLSVIRAPNGVVTHYIGLFNDITERKNAEDRIHHLAHHDKLTGLLNRHSLQDRLEQALATAQRTHIPLAVMFIDMDRFKLINDTLGHHVGDLLLIEVARRLSANVRRSDIVARLGGDEFVVVLTGIEAAYDAFPVGGKILDALGRPYEIEGNVLYSTPSIGLGLYPGDGNTVDELMKSADTAMYHAKVQGRNNIQFFTADMNAAAAERMELERDLRKALLEGGQLELHYQHQVLAHSGAVAGVEALVRWRHPQRGVVSPLKFIPIAEESGLIELLGHWVLEEACRQIAAWRAAGVSGLRMAVNLSAHQLRAESLVGQVREAIQRHGILSGELELEITESAAMQDPELAIRRLQELRDLGVMLAIDDFGTGYSSLAYLKLLPVHTLKIDRSFVKDIEADENDAAISASILALAHSLGLKVVAEGVETEAQCDFLRAHDCDYLQGYYFARPEPAARCFELLQGQVR